jgi:hypothetical protein
MVTKAVAGALALAAALAATAAAAHEPFAFGTAKDASFSVTSGVIVAPRSAELRGVWLDDTRPCSERRVLRVSVEVFYSSASAATKRKHLVKSGRVGNCAEGGPNFGFLFRAARYGFACPSGAWKPGSYAFATTTKDVAGGLTAVASLNWDKVGAC